MSERRDFNLRERLLILIGRRAQAKHAWQKRQPPGFRDFPDQTGRTLTLRDAVHLCAPNLTNGELPAVGDVVVDLLTCGMGVQIQKDQRWRVLERTTSKPYGGGSSLNPSGTYATVIAEHESDPGRRSVMIVENLRRASAPRTWIRAY